MKKMSEVRKLDDLGRICLPAEMRIRLRLEQGAMLAIHVERDLIILQKATERCYICGREAETRKFMNKGICQCCLDEARRETPVSPSDGW